MEPRSWSGCRRSGWGTLVACLSVSAFYGLSAQELMPRMDGMVRLMPSDAVILENTDNRKDLPCTVTPDKAALGFDMKFHLGYDVSVPIKELAGLDNLLT